MRAIAVLALAGWFQQGGVRYHFTDDDGRPFELRLRQPVAKVHFDLLPPPQTLRLLLRTSLVSEDAPEGRYTTGTRIPEYTSGTILADFRTHP
jgi:hypothetical protein